MTSKPPFYTGDLTHQVLHKAPEPMAERLAALGMRNEIPPDAAALIMACLAKEPGQRPPSARAVAEWIGMELEVKPSAESLAAALFPETPSVPAAVTSQPAEQSRSRPAVSGRNLAAVGIVVLVMAAAFWLRRGSLRGDHSNAPVAAQVPVSTEPSNESQAPPIGAPPEAALSPQEATSRSAIPTESMAKPQVPQKIKTEVPAISYSDFPADLQPALDKLVENMKKQGAFCIAGRVTFSDGAPVKGGDQLVISYKFVPLTIYSNGWFMVRRPLEAYDLEKGQIRVRSFLYDPVDLSVAPHSNGITYVAFELHRTPKQNLTKIQGRVEDEHGTPIRGADVELMFSGMAAPFPPKHILTGNDGKFAFFELAPASNYHIFVSSPGRGYDTAFFSTHPGQVFDTNMTLYPARNITFDYVGQTNGTRDFTGSGVLRGTRTVEITKIGPNLVMPKNLPSDDLRLDQIQNKLAFLCTYRGPKDNGFYDAGAVDFDSITEAPEKGYSMQRFDCVVGHVYVVKTYEGYYAKLIVKTD